MVFPFLCINACLLGRALSLFHHEPLPPKKKNSRRDRPWPFFHTLCNYMYKQVRTAAIRTEEAWRHEVQGVGRGGTNETEVNLSSGTRVRYRSKGKRKIVSSSMQAGGALVMEEQADGARLLSKVHGLGVLPDFALKVCEPPILEMPQTLNEMCPSNRRRHRTRSHPPWRHPEPKSSL